MKPRSAIFRCVTEPGLFLVLNLQTGKASTIRGTEEQIKAIVEEAEKELDTPKLAS